MGEPSTRRETVVRAGPGDASRLDTWLGVAVAVLPLALAIVRATAGAQWRGDIASVRDEGLVAVGLGGSVSTALAQLTSLLPLGTRAFRSALGAAFVLGLAAHLVWRIGRRFLHEALSNARGRDPGALPAWVSSLLAAVAAAGATLAPSWQAEATVGGGAMVAAALGAACLHQCVELVAASASTFTPESGARWLRLAALLGALLAENLPAGLAIGVACTVGFAVARRRPASGLRWPIAIVAVGATALLLAPSLVRPLGPRSWSELGQVLTATGLGSLDRGGARALPGLFAWARELGWIALGVAAFGLVSGALRRYGRPIVGALVTIVVADLFYPAGGSPAASADPLAATRLLALAALSVVSALAMAELVRFLLGLRVPLARAAAVLVVVFQITIVAVSSEEAGFVSSRQGLVATEEWTDAALGDLPPRSAVLVDEPAMAWRLWAARLCRGERPDVAIVPTPLLRRGFATGELVRAEPAISLLLRDLALGGPASEYALSLLADARPLYVELGDQWDDRLVAHVSPSGAWLRFAPEVLGTSDRKDLAPGAFAPTGRLVSSLDSGPARDGVTAAIVADALRRRAAALSLLALRDAAGDVLEQLGSVSPRDAFVEAARLRLGYAAHSHARGPVELRDLLRYE